jgi:quinol-cytochrome oxidoreductase complex cytochrome b subunit
MAYKRKVIIKEPKYDPPYPQSFYAFWPKHAIRSGLLIALIFLGLLLLSFYLRVPIDPIMPPLPDEGAYIPAPEWYLFFLFQPFWYLTDENAKWLSLGTFWLPLLVLAFLFLVPVIFRKREGPRVKMESGMKVVLAIGVSAIWIISMGAVVGSGAPAKTLGCPSCHNPMMGVRQALPPANMAEYYKTDRQRQINLGGYNIGTEGHVGGSYKDANWQLRHFYEPTMTW